MTNSLARWIPPVYTVQLCFFFSQIASAQLPTPSVNALSRQAGQVGTSFSMRPLGQRLDELQVLKIADLTGRETELQVDAHVAPKQLMRDLSMTTGEFQITSGHNSTAGLFDVDVLGRFGLSNSRPFLLVDVPVVVPSGDRWSKATASEVSSGTIVNDRFEPLKSNFYRIRIDSQQQLRTVAYSKQLDSLADLSIKLWSGQGQLVASARSQGIWPAELVWLHNQGVSEEYFLEFSDLLGRGGEQYFYLVENRLAPLTTASPMEAGSRENSSVAAQTFEMVSDTLLHAATLDTLLRPCLKMPPGPERFLNPLAIAWLRHKGNNSINELPHKLIREFPASFQGCLEEPFSIDIEAQQGQTLVFDVTSATLDQLTDPAIVVYRHNRSAAESSDQEFPDHQSSVSLSLVAEQDDAPHLGTPEMRIRRLDPHLVWTAPESGIYRVVVLDNQSGDRPIDSIRFNLEIRPPKPGFSLIAYRAFPTNNPATSRPWGSHLIRRGTEQIHLTLIRHDGFAGPVQAAIGGLPPNCTSHPVVIPPGVTEADLIIQSDDEPVDTLSNLEIWGSALIGDSEYKSLAVNAAVTSGVTPTLNAVQFRRASSLPLAVSSLETAPLQIRIGHEGVIELKRGSKTTVPVKLYRNEGSAHECTLRPQSLPPKVTIAETPIAADLGEASVEVTVADDAPLGSFTIWLQAETKVKWRLNPQSLVREEQYLSQLQETLDRLTATNDLDGSLKSSNPGSDLPSAEALTAAITSVQERIEQLRKETAEQEISLWLPSNTLPVLIIESE
jgi:hypothetical protein